MSDLKFGGSPPETAALYLSDEALKQGLDLLFIAARNLSAQSAEALSKAGLGRAHARALHFIARRPGLSVAELLDCLKITKQSLNRVLNDLLRGGYVERKTGMQDRRTRRLQLTPAGRMLTDSIWSAQRPLMVSAFKGAGQDAVNGFRKVVQGMIREDRLRSHKS
ncbi:MAG: MarR family transcriptional regulator [Alphaproteobacteria bacterium]|nr:MarR family transcriptional regulator [Alphaproteobacteria bacterium]